MLSAFLGPAVLGSLSLAPLILLILLDDGPWVARQVRDWLLRA